MGLCILIVSIGLAGCIINNSNTNIGNKVLDSNNLIVRAMGVMEVIKDKDMERLSSIVHPTKGVRFAAYPYVDLELDQVFQGDELVSAFEGSQVYKWGSYDGSGEPIEISFREYYDRFIYDVDFFNPQLIGNNTIIGHGNTEENVSKAYPNGQFIEFYFSGINPEYEGIDWRSLKLVFEQEDGTWYLVGIIHGEWTI